MSILTILGLLLYGGLSIKDSVESKSYMDEKRTESKLMNNPYYFDRRCRMYSTQTGERVYKTFEYYYPKGATEYELRDVLKTVKRPERVVYRYPADSDIKKKKYAWIIERNKKEAIQKDCPLFRTYVNDASTDMKYFNVKIPPYHKRFECIDNGEIYSLHASYDSLDEDKRGFERYGYTYWACCDYLDLYIKLSWSQYTFLCEQTL